MVALQILVLSVQVRILVSQQILFRVKVLWVGARDALRNFFSQLFK